MMPAIFGPFRTNCLDVIAILVDFNRRPAAILDFAKFHFFRVWGAKTELGLKFDDNRMYTSRVIQVCMKIQDGIGGHLVFKISVFSIPCCGCGTDAKYRIW